MVLKTGSQTALAHTCSPYFTHAPFTRGMSAPASAPPAPVPPRDLCRVQDVPARPCSTWRTKYRPATPQVLGFAHGETALSSNNRFSGNNWSLSHLSHKALRAIISFQSGLRFTETAFFLFYAHQGIKKYKNIKKKFKKKLNMSLYRNFLPGQRSTWRSGVGIQRCAPSLPYSTSQRVSPRCKIPGRAFPGAGGGTVA